MRCPHTKPIWAHFTHENCGTLAACPISEEEEMISRNRQGMKGINKKKVVHTMQESFSSVDLPYFLPIARLKYIKCPIVCLLTIYEVKGCPKQMKRRTIRKKVRRNMRRIVLMPAFNITQLAKVTLEICVHKLLILSL